MMINLINVDDDFSHLCTYDGIKKQAWATWFEFFKLLKAMAMHVRSDQANLCFCFCNYYFTISKRNSTIHLQCKTKKEKKTK